MPATRPPKAIPDRARGFSLLEVLAAIALVSIVTAIAAPSLVRAQRNQVMLFALEQAGTLVSQARITAMMERKCVRVRVNNGDLEYHISDQVHCDTLAVLGPLPATGWGSALGKVRADSPLVTYSISSSTEQPGSGDSTHIIFRGTGRLWADDATAAQTKTQQIIATHASGDTLRLTVCPHGAIRIGNTGC